MEENLDTPPQAGGFRRILLCVDSSEASECADTIVRRLARPDFEVTLAAVAQDSRLLATSVEHDVSLEEAERVIEKARNALADVAVAVHTRVIDLAKETGDVAGALTRSAREHRTELVIVAVRQHHGLVRWFEPSAVDTLSRLGPYGIVVAPAGFASGRDVALQRILFAIDGSPTSFAALATGVMLATPDTQIRVVYVVDRAVRSGGAAPTAILEDTFVKEGERAIATASEMLHSHRTHSRLQFSADLIRTDVSSDDISRALLHDAERWHADLMVMGTHGRRGDARSYLGSVPNKVASLAKIPVFLVHERHDGNDHSAAAE